MPHSFSVPLPSLETRSHAIRFLSRNPQFHRALASPALATRAKPFLVYCWSAVGACAFGMNCICVAIEKGRTRVRRKPRQRAGSLRKAFAQSCSKLAVRQLSYRLCGAAVRRGLHPTRNAGGVPDARRDALPRAAATTPAPLVKVEAIRLAHAAAPLRGPLPRRASRLVPARCALASKVSITWHMHGLCLQPPAFAKKDRTRRAAPARLWALYT